VFVPILLIKMVSWITFFLKDYGRRIEVSTANRLLFIAFSWRLAENYQRLGYLTFLDAVMAIMFVVNVLVVVYNVWLKRMEMRARSAGGTCRWGSQLGLSFGLHRAIWTGDTAFFLVCGDITPAFALGFYTRED
jgi:hypothetical protein